MTFSYRPSPSFIIALIVLAACYFLIPTVGEILGPLYVKYM